MSDRRKYEGEEDLQLQLLEVTEDPTFGKHEPQRQRALTARGELDLEGAGTEGEMRAAKVLH